MQPKRVLITGGAGFIGTHLCAALVRKGSRVSVIDLRAPKVAIAGVEYHRGDILVASDLAPLIDVADCVVHLAAKVSVPLCEEDPIGSYETNFMGTVRVARAIAEANRKRTPAGTRISLLFASSAAVYGNLGNENALLTENAALPSPLSNYAHQKRASEEALRLFAAEVPSWSFRFFNVYGPGQDPLSPYSGVISVFSERLRKGLSLNLYGDGNQTRDFIAVQDIVAALSAAIDQPIDKKDGSVVNLCSSKRATIRELAEMLARLSSKPLVWTSLPARVGDVRHSCGDRSRAAALFGWRPEVELETGLRAALTGL